MISFLICFPEFCRNQTEFTFKRQAYLFRCEHIPGAVGAKDQATVPADVDGVDVGVGLGRDDEHVLFRVVAPEIAQRPRHRQKRNLVDVRRAPDGALVTHFRPVPDYSRHAALANDFAAALLDPAAFFIRLWLVVARQGLSVPGVGLAGVLGTENDGRVADMTDVDLATPDKCDAGSGAGSAGQSRHRFGPFFCQTKVAKLRRVGKKLKTLEIRSRFIQTKVFLKAG